jgi:DNA polymerase III epsilon subunit-like protein
MDSMSFIIVDVESDGPIPAEYSMVCFGAVLFDDRLDRTFYGKTRPISDRLVPEALAVSGFSREEHLRFEDPKTVMESFAKWLEAQARGRPVFISDNVAFDWQWINYYFHRFLGRNPFGFSGRRIGDLYAGLVKDASKAAEWKKYRVTGHTHNPVDDARGNAEALRKFKELGLKI